MGEDDVVEVGVLLECWKISSSKCECPGGEVATSVWAARTQKTTLSGAKAKDGGFQSHRVAPLNTTTVGLTSLVFSFSFYHDGSLFFVCFSTYGCLPGPGRRRETRSPQSLGPVKSLCNTPHHPFKKKREEED